MAESLEERFDAVTYTEQPICTCGKRFCNKSAYMQVCYIVVRVAIDTLLIMVRGQYLQSDGGRFE